MAADHQVSMRLETMGRRAIGADGRGALYGIVDADYIDQIGNAFTVLAVSVAPYYKGSSRDEKAEIENFLKKYSFLGELDISREEYTAGVSSAVDELRIFLDSF